ncbi:DUF1275 family protein [Herbiconiux liangxiaofengii]|uniref:DUF1275 family protein n=1 Tax=Herbiconiux liangxiaofengii TaxID=3342795 RepID=UPI0035B96FB6
MTAPHDGQPHDGHSAADRAAGAPRRLTPLHAALVLLSFSAGCADAFAFLALNGTFTANMTGNLVLAAMFTRAGFPTTVTCALLAVVVFAVVLYVGFRLTRTTDATSTPARAGAKPDAAPSAGRARGFVIRFVLVPSLVAQAVAAVVWLVGWRDVVLPVQCAVIGLSAAALALQTVAAKKLSDVGGVTTTYVTGTLTTTMQELAERDDRGQGIRVLSIVALPAGALAATALVHLASWAGPLLPLAVSAVATWIAHAALRSPSPSPAATLDSSR